MAKELSAGEKVKLIGTEFEGTVQNVHDGGHLIDVELLDGTLTTLPAGSVQASEEE